MLSRFTSVAFRPAIAYNGYLERHPLLTKSITSGVMYGCGDVIAQVVEQGTDYKKSYKDYIISYKRTGIFFLFGIFIAGPSYHYWFNYLNELPAALWSLKQSNQRWRILRAYAILKSHGIDVKLDMEKMPKAAKIGKWTSKFVKIAVDQLVFSSLYTLIFFVSIGGMSGALAKIEQDYKYNKLIRESSVDTDVLDNSTETYTTTTDTTTDSINTSTNNTTPTTDTGTDSLPLSPAAMSWEDVYNKAWSHTKDVYIETYLTDCIVWPPIQLINFTFIPLRFQFLYVNFANLGWNTFLSLMANKSGADKGSEKGHNSDLSSSNKRADNTK